MEIGQIYFGRYKVQKKLGEGAYGIVWLADDQLLCRRVAIKELTDQHHAPQLIEEARAAAQTGHPNIVQVYDVMADPADGLTRYIVLEYLAGGTLRQQLYQQGKLATEEAFKIALDVCQGLQAAHNKGPIIHGDIKPDNILFDERGVVKITDFGAYLPRKLGGQSYRPVGTPLYQPPQLLLGEAEVTVQNDLYAVVVTLYEMLCGSFITEDKQISSSNFYLRAKTPIEGLGVLIHLFVSHAPLVLPQERNPALPPELDAIFVKGLAYEPGDRYQTVEELIEALQEGLKLCSRVGPLAVQVTLPPVSDQFAQTIAPCLRHGWVTDPWQEENPYNVMETFFIGPRSSMREIEDCSPAQMTEPQRAAWKQLQDLSTRLFVDSFLYRVEQSHELIAVVKEHLAAHRRLPPIEQVPSSLQNEWPLILLLAGEREECLAAWTDIQRTDRERTDPSVIHSLAVAYTFLAQRQEKEGQIAAAIASWRRAMANWAWILARDDFWAAWASSRARCYQVRITPQHVSELRQQLQGYFSSRFAEGSRVLPPDCPAEIRQAYAELGLEWQIEWAGLRALKRLQADQPDSQIVRPEVGPSLAPELGLEESLARLVLDRTKATEDIVFLLTSSLDAQQTQQNVQDVRLYYSQLGRAAAWLDCSQPERALTAIPVAEEDPDFDRLNPPYCLLPDKRALWEKDRVELAMRAHLQLANAHLQREPWDVEAIVAQWTEILSLGAPINDTDLAINMIHDQALAYLHPPTDDEGRQRQQLALAEATRQIIGLTSRLESVLRRLRGKGKPAEEAPSESSLDLEILLGMDRRRQEQADISWQEQAKKLYAVLQVNPADEDARQQLAQLLVKHLEQLIDEEQIETARQIVDEWYTKLDRHSLLQGPYHYLRHGYKVALHLSQTDLIYNTNLLEAHTYSLPWRMKHTDDIIVKLKVEGDLVRIFAPLSRFAEPPGADVQRNLLQATWGMPFYKVCHRPNGEYGLMVETLANSLSPALLEQLIRSLTSRVDLSATHLQSVSALQQVMDKYAPDLSLRAGEPPTERDFERWQGQLLAQCQHMDLECTLTGGFVYWLKRRTASGEPIQLDFQAPVVTFQARIGDQYQLDRNLYERMMGWNSSTRLCKLALAPDDAVVLRCEILDLDDEETLVRMLNIVFEGQTQSESWLAWHLM